MRLPERLNAVLTVIACLLAVLGALGVVELVWYWFIRSLFIMCGGSP
jgi:hypothetical protein